MFARGDEFCPEDTCRASGDGANGGCAGDSEVRTGSRLFSCPARELVSPLFRLLRKPATKRPVRDGAGSDGVGPSGDGSAAVK